MSDAVAFVGLGAMGAPMASNLVRAGVSVRLYDTDRDAIDRVAAAGPSATACGSLGDAVQAAGVLITMLPDGAAVRSVVEAAHPAPGMLVIDMSSSAPSDVVALAEMLSGRGVSLIDAPVSGGVTKATDGTLSILVGGEAADLERARPLLEIMGARIFHCGAAGSGDAMKALNNLLSAAGLAAMVEVLIAGKRFGLDPALMVDVLNASTGRSHSTEAKAKQFMLSGEPTSGFAYDLMVKDIANALAIVGDGDTTMPVCATAVERWQAGRTELGERPDHTEIARAYAALTGVSLSDP